MSADDLRNSEVEKLMVSGAGDRCIESQDYNPELCPDSYTRSDSNHDDALNVDRGFEKGLRHMNIRRDAHTSTDPSDHEVMPVDREHGNGRRHMQIPQDLHTFTDPSDDEVPEFDLRDGNGRWHMQGPREEHTPNDSHEQRQISRRWNRQVISRNSDKIVDAQIDRVEPVRRGIFGRRFSMVSYCHADSLCVHTTVTCRILESVSMVWERARVAVE